MMQHNIFITEEDMERLRLLLDPGTMSMGRDQEHLEMLEGELDRAQIVSPSRVPAEVVTMNSKVRVKDLVTGKDATYTLVFRGMPISLRERSQCLLLLERPSWDTAQVM